MATGAIAGFEGYLYIGTGAGTGSAAFRLVGEVRSITLNVELGVIDANSHDNPSWAESIPGRKSWSGSMEGLYVGANTAQDDIYAALEGKTLEEWSSVK